MDHPASAQLVTALEDALVACLTTDSAVEKPTAQAVSSIWWVLPVAHCRCSSVAACPW